MGECIEIPVCTRCPMCGALPDIIRNDDGAIVRIACDGHISVNDQTGERGDELVNTWNDSVGYIKKRRREK